VAVSSPRRIYVDRQSVAANRARVPAERAPVFRVERDGEVVAAHEVELLFGARLVYRPEALLADGAAAWVEADGAVLADGRLV
jgi:hypothetical protein